MLPKLICTLNISYGSTVIWVNRRTWALPYAGKVFLKFEQWIYSGKSGLTLRGRSARTLLAGDLMTVVLLLGWQWPHEVSRCSARPFYKISLNGRQTNHADLDQIWLGASAPNILMTDAFHMNLFLRIPMWTLLYYDGMVQLRKDRPLWKEGFGELHVVVTLFSAQIPHDGFMQPYSLDVRRLRDESVAQEYKWKFVESSDEFNDSDDIEKLQTDFKIQNLKVSLSCLRGIHRTSRSFLIWDFLEHL